MSVIISHYGCLVMLELMLKYQSATILIDYTPQCKVISIYLWNLTIVNGVIWNQNELYALKIRIKMNFLH